MNIESLIVLGVVSFIFLLSIVLTGTVILILTYIKTAKLETSIAERFTSLYSVLDRISADVNVESFMKSAGEPIPYESFPVGMPLKAGNMIFKSMDGKYQASNMPELLKKMIDDPDSGFTQQQIDDLKKLFERLVGESPDNNDPDDTDDTWRSTK